MILYNVTVKIDNDVAAEWLQWMQTVHIPDVMRTGYFSENRILKLLGDDDTEATTYAIQYFCSSIEQYENYNELFAPALREQHTNKFKNKFVAFRTLLEIIK